ncbi:MAG: DUF2236 domain-containing protein [Chloroflexi bacterium]|nr:MAG: DUF2236 domain-containing protein [Chloroflexota bacterium]
MRQSLGDVAVEGGPGRCAQVPGQDAGCGERLPVGPGQEAGDSRRPLRGPPLQPDQPFGVRQLRGVLEVQVDESVQGGPAQQRQSDHGGHLMAADKAAVQLGAGIPRQQRAPGRRQPDVGAVSAEPKVSGRFPGRFVGEVAGDLVPHVGERIAQPVLRHAHREWRVELVRLLVVEVERGDLGAGGLDEPGQQAAQQVSQRRSAELAWGRRCPRHAPVAHSLGKVNPGSAHNRLMVELGSVAWRVNSENALLLGGGRALLMQLAHPKVAQGVADHSDFERDPIGRLNRTMELSLALSFGTPAEVTGAARQINQVHGRVRGDGYSATDPDLLLWVYATLIDSALLTYRTFVSSLNEADAEAYYQQNRPIGELLRIPQASFPPTLADFEAYVEGMLHGGPVQVGEVARRLSAQVLRPHVPRLPGAVFAPFAVITTGLLPPVLREGYGLPWRGLQRSGYRAAVTAVRTLLPVTPQRLRLVPQARHSAA